MSSSHNSSSHLMRRLVPKTLRGSRQNRTQIRTESPTTNASAALPFVSHPSTLPAAATVMPALFPSEVQSDIFKNEPRSAPHPPTRPPRPPTLSTGDPIVTYHTNFLGLFSGDGETPIATTLPPKLTDLVPPMQVHPAEHDYDTSVPGETPPVTSRADRAPGVPRAKVIEDFDYVGGWIADAGGKQQYVSRGHIEEIEEDVERDVGIPSGSNPAGPSVIAGLSSRFLDALSLPASTTPPPRPLLNTTRDLPLSQSDSGSNNHPFHHPFFTKHKPLATSRQFAASPLSQSVSSLAHMPLRGFTSLYHTGGQGPTGPEQNTFFGPSASHDTDVDMRYEPLPVGFPPFDPLADSLSSLPGLRGFAPFTPHTERISEEKITSTPEPFEHSPYPTFESLGHSLDSISPAQQADRSEKELPLPPSPTSQIPLPHPVMGTEEEPMNPTLPTPAPFPHVGDLSDPIIILPLHESTPPRNPKRNGRTSGKNDAQPGDARNGSEKEKENRTDERIQETEQRISTSIKEIVEMVRGVRGTLSSFYPIRTVVPHLEMCTHIEHSLSRVEKTLITRRTLTEEEWGLFMERRKRYVKRLGSLQRCLRRLSDVAKRPVESTNTSMLDTLLRKLEEHNDKLTNVADKLDDTFERLKLRHLHAIASRLTEEAHRGRDVYLSAKEVYLRRKSMTRKSTRNLREGARGLGKSAIRKTSRINSGGPRGFGHGEFAGTGGKGGDRPPRSTRPTRPTVQPGMGSH